MGFSLSILHEVWVMFSSHGVKGITFHTVEVMMNIDGELYFFTVFFGSFNGLHFKPPFHLITLLFVFPVSLCLFPRV